MMTLSESLGQKCHPVSHAAPLKRNTPHPLFIFVFESQTNGGSGKKKPMGAIPSVPSRFSVLFPSPLLHASRGQAWSPRARTKQSLPSRFSQSPVCVFQTRQSLPSRFSQSLVCFFLSLEQHDPISAMWARRVLPPCLLHASRRQNMASSSKHDPICATSVGSVKVLCVFFLSVERARSHLCQVV